ncbi:hypothetical protein L1987_82717 [Smallanthus sonchifolius]|uniref:Uncharacterized protein n=1 Tax=Smallanthus sonchifolius TaxID=185202 RepID=A0ACB8YBJ7_9ASTR|nr:hypothetical protein L1987_82717 [Smallanthus sonchifolius]
MSTAISSPPAYSRFPSNPQTLRTLNSVTCLKLTNNHGKRAEGLFFQKKSVLPIRRFRCNCSSTPPGDNESKQILDAFFLGKAFAEALNERIESTVGEFLSTVGRLQAEQQRQVQEFQDEVLEKAKKAKAKAAREAMEAQGLVPKSTASNNSSPTANQPDTASATVDEPKNFTSSSSPGSKDQSMDNGSTDPLLEISIDD